MLTADALPPVSITAAVSQVWVADNRDGTYTNPIIHADYSDPDVIRINQDYFMTASSFTCLPGLPVLHSKDLVNWSIIGHALKKYPHAAFDRPQYGKGVWAPAIRYHDQSFYIYWGDPDEGIYMTQSTDPAGPWDKPILTLAGKGLIDTCPLWDDDGKAWLVHGWAASRAGVNSLLTLREMSPDGARVSEEGRHVFDGHDKHPTLEGPKFYKRNGYYYILAPAGGVTSGWQLALRSKDIYGPYEEKIVLAQGGSPTNGPHQGGWVETPSGQSWFIHFQDKNAYGRIIHLQPVEWIEDWPEMGTQKGNGTPGEPVLKYQKPEIAGNFFVVTPAGSDEFNTDTLGLQWQWLGNPQITWYALMRGSGYLRLFATKMGPEDSNLLDAPHLLLQKLPAPDFTATTKLKFTPPFDGKRAGLMIFGGDYGCIYISRQKEKLSITQAECIKADQKAKEIPIAETETKADTLWLQVTVSSPDARCQFSYSLDGTSFVPLGKPFTAKPGGWMGAKVGLFCVSEYGAKNGGYCDFDYFQIDKASQP